MGHAQRASEGAGREENETNGFNSKVVQLSAHLRASWALLALREVSCLSSSVTLQVN